MARTYLDLGAVYLERCWFGDALDEFEKTIKLDPGKSPKEIDMMSHDGQESGQTAAGIQACSGSQLEQSRIPPQAMSLPSHGDNVSRPASLESSGISPFL